MTSLHYAKEHVFDDTGFTVLIDYLGKDVANIRLEQVVTEIRHNGTFVEVSTSGGQRYRTDFVLITVRGGTLLLLYKVK